jgi:uncharacterized membrane protein
VNKFFESVGAGLLHFVKTIAIVLVISFLGVMLYIGLRFFIEALFIKKGNTENKPIVQQVDKKPEQTIPEKIDLVCGSKLLSINYNNNALTILTTRFERFDKAGTYEYSVNGKKTVITECDLVSN